MFRVPGKTDAENIYDTVVRIVRRQDASPSEVNK